MNTTRDPETLTPNQRRREVASILTLGILRLRRVPNLDPSATPPQSSAQFDNFLEVFPESRLHVADGSAG